MLRRVLFACSSEYKAFSGIPPVGQRFPRVMIDVARTRFAVSLLVVIVSVRCPCCRLISPIVAR